MFKFRKRYSVEPTRAGWAKRLIMGLLVLAGLLVAGIVGARLFYDASLKAVSESGESQTVIVEQGATVDQIAAELKSKQLIRSDLVFALYIRSKQASNPLIAGTYRLQQNLSTPQIVSILSHGKVATDLVTILPGQRIDQIKASLVKNGFSETSVEAALDPVQYKDHPVLTDKPMDANLEGYLYPESFQRTATTDPKEIIEASLDLMNEQLTPKLRTEFARKGLTTYQALVLASMIEQEASGTNDRKQVAQTFLTRMSMGMRLESDPTATYGALLDDASPSNSYVSAYNTYKIDGLPPTPISNVSKSSLQAVASPASTEWIYFVAGDDGTVHFSKTLDEHESLTNQYCTKLCGN
jgi:UPF0755 protein